MYNKEFKYSLDKSSKKVNCPNCTKKTFVLYVDNETREYLPFEFGRCDREVECGYFRQPTKGGTIISEVLCSPVERKPSFLPLEYVDHYFDLKAQKQNRFTNFLYNRFPKNEIDRVIKDYLISTCSKWDAGATIFWQIDEKENVRTGQVILYDESTGKRIKEPFNHITWVHTMLEKNGKIKDFNLKQCLFGLHLIAQQPEKELIAIVEAPKTACIMASIFPNYIWMASCGLSNLKEDKFRALREKKIVLYPDLGAFDRWREKADALKKYGYRIEVSELLENKCPASQKGMDIADYFIIQNKINSKQASKINK